MPARIMELSIVFTITGIKFDELSKLSHALGKIFFSISSPHNSYINIVPPLLIFFILTQQSLEL